VVVKLELADRVVEVEATPLQASITELFENQDTWDAQAMSDRLGVDLFQVRNGLAFWANEGVVKEEKGVWRLLEHAEEGNDAPGKLHGPDETRELIGQPSFKRNRLSRVLTRAVPRMYGYIGRYVSLVQYLLVHAC
jgi:hypothetical protein